MNKRDLKLLATLTRYLMENPDEGETTVGMEGFLQAVAKSFLPQNQSFSKLFSHVVLQDAPPNRAFIRSEENPNVSLLLFVQSNLPPAHSEVLGLATSLFLQQQNIGSDKPTAKNLFDAYQNNVNKLLEINPIECEWQAAAMVVDLPMRKVDFYGKGSELWLCANKQIFSLHDLGGKLNLAEADYLFIAPEHIAENEKLQTFAYAVMQVEESLQKTLHDIENPTSAFSYAFLSC